MYRITIRPDQLAFTHRAETAMEALDALLAGCKLLGYSVSPQERDQYAARLLSMGSKSLVRCCSFALYNYAIIAEIA